MKSLFRAGVLLLLILATAVPRVLADAKILNVIISPHVLQEVYKAYQDGRTNVPMINANVVQMTVASTEAASSFLFRLEVWDDRTRVMDVNFQTTSPLPIGTTIFNAAQIAATGSPINYNDDYMTSENIGEIITGNSVLQGNFYLVLVPIKPSGPPYRARVTMFATRGSQNLPPNLVYPRNVEITTVLPNFVWTPGSRKAVSYEVLVSPDQNPQVNTYWRSSRMPATQAIYPPSARALANGEKYYWQVRAFDAFGNPVGGNAGKSPPAWFRVNSAARASTAVTPPEVDRVLRQVIPKPEVFKRLKNYRPVGLESTHPDLADLLRQLQDGSAKVTSYVVE